MVKVIDGKEYFEDASGNLVPKEVIKPVDLLRDDVVSSLVERAKTMSSKIKEFKEYSFEEIAKFIEISAEEYGVKTGGKKGNVTLTSYDGKYKVQRVFADNISFNERLQVAKDLIDQCIHKWSNGANSNIITLVNHAFQTDKEGKVSVSRILGLKRLHIQDEEWQKAMMAISDSVNVLASKGYIRFYERMESGQYKAIPLDVAADF